MSFVFNHEATQFDLANALRLAEASQLAYKNEQQINDFVSKEWDFAPCAFFDVMDTQAFVIANSHVIIVAFRGTEQSSIKDWMTDLTFKQMASKVGMVHEGFALALNRIWKKLESKVKELRTNEQALWLTGHSLGGALATIAADRFTDNQMQVHGLYTFGQPRVGDKAFARNFNAKMDGRAFRMVNNEDIVTRAPLGYQNYEHVGQLVYFDSWGNRHQGVPWFLKWLDRLLSKFNRFFAKEKIDNVDLSNDVQDHDLARYISLVKKVSV